MSTRKADQGARGAPPSGKQNRLAKETSPYLLQHAGNPVDWYAWGPEALERAKAEDKPIFLSIGYSACHWCHVMERESFEDEEVARSLNAGFVPVKVDREERPDIDSVYMTATVAMSGGGGWPMSVFLAPDGRPFFAGTYFPKTSRYGRPGFLDILGKIREMWTSQRAELLEQASELASAIEAEASADPPRAVDARADQMAAAQLLRSFDEAWGGFGGAPKFPAPGSLSLLLRAYDAMKDPKLLEGVVTTLDRMARGGIYDHVGGGFARYSTDEKWHVPHFEKMLYDNAQLARVYVEAWQVTGDARWRAVAEETLDYVVREMQGSHGGYFSATDADSEGEEGKFFVWTKDEIEALLPPGDARAFIAAFDVRPRGNWEGHNVLWMPTALDDVAKETGLSRAEIDAAVARSKKVLYAARSKRVPPSLDDKVLVSWNALMIGAMAFAARALGAQRFLASAERAVTMIRTTMRDGPKLLRTFRDGKAHIDAFLEDYAYLADALVDVYEAGGDPTALAEAEQLASYALVAFKSDDGGGFCTTSAQHEDLVVRMRDSADNATPSANGVLARALARLAAHLGRDDLRQAAEGAVRAHGRAIGRAPRAFATTLDALNRLIAPPIEVALIGSPGEGGFEALAAVLGRTFLPAAVLARLDPAGPPQASPHPLLEGKTLVGGKAAAYVCRSFACQAPVTSADDLARTLEDAKQKARADRRSALDVPTIGASGATPQATAELARRRPDAPTGSLLDLVVDRSGVLVASYREDQIASVVERALGAGRNLLAFDRQRATAVGDAIEAAVKSGSLTREAVVLIGILPVNEPWSEAVKMAKSLAAEARVSRVDVLLVPWRRASSEAAAETLAHLASSNVAAHLGVALDEPLEDAQLDAFVEQLPSCVRVVAAPFNWLEGDPAMPGRCAAAGKAFLALRPLDPRAEAQGRGHLVQLADSPAAADLPEAPALAPALAALAALETEYRSTIAVHLRIQGEAEIDPKDLLGWSEELGRAEKSLDDLLEVEAFVGQSVTPALRAQFAALSSIGGELAPKVESLRDRYLEALDRALKALARRVVGRQAAMRGALAKAVGTTEQGLPAAGLGAVLGIAGVAAALVTARMPSHVDASVAVASTPLEDSFAKARAAMKKP